MVTITIFLVQRNIRVVLLSQVVAMLVNIFILQLVLIAEFSFLVYHTVSANQHTVRIDTFAVQGTSVLRSAKTLCLKGMCNHLADLC